MDNNRYDFYANFVQVTTSLYDVTLHFRTQSPVFLEEGQAPVIETSGICNIRMSPQHAKSLASLLVKHIVDYENNADVKLPLPPNLEKMWEEYIINMENDK